MKKKRDRRPAPEPELNLDAKLQQSLVRLGAKDPMFYGWRLARLREVRGLSFEQQADALGLTHSALAYLSLCKVPRPGRRAEDLATVADKIGASVEMLEGILREADEVEPDA